MAYPPNFHLVMIADDLCGQKGPLMSPQLYRKILKPCQKRYFDFVKKHTSAKLLYYCCGNVYPLIEDLIEMGVDGLNPVQVSAEGMDTRRLKKEFGDSLTFWGGIDTQHVLPHRTINEVKEEVRGRIEDLADGLYKVEGT